MSTGNVSRTASPTKGEAKTNEIPQTVSTLEPAPTFAEGANASGRWSVDHFRSEYGDSFKIYYDGAEVTEQFISIYFAAFDFNDYKGKVTSSCHLGGCILALSSVPDHAITAMRELCGKMRADQAVIKDVMEKFFAANTKKFPPHLDDEQRPMARQWKSAVAFKPGRVDKKNPSQMKPGMWQIGSSLSVVRESGRGDPRQDVISTPIIIDCKPYSGLTRAGLYDLLRDKTFIRITVGHFGVFCGSLGNFIQFKSDSESLKTIQRKKILSDEDLKKLVDASSSRFKELGFDMSASIEEEEGDEGEGSDEGKGKEPVRDPAPSGTSQPSDQIQKLIDGVGIFTCMPSTKNP